MLSLDRLFDDRFEEVIRFTNGGFRGRATTALLSAGVMGLAVKPAVAAGWLAAFLTAELWASIAMRPMAGGRVGTPRQRLRLGLSAITAVGVWTSASAIYWLTGSPALQFAGICGLMGILLSAQTQCARSPTMLAIVSAPPLLAMTVLGLVFGGYHGLGLVLVCMTLAMVLAQLLIGAGAHRRAAEKLERLQQCAVDANEAKSAFLAMMSHEIRTPMNGVLGMAHALAGGPLNDEQRRQVGMLTRSGDGLMTILNDILDLSKIEAGKLTLEATVFDLHEVVASVRDLWLAAAEAKGLAFACIIDPSVPRWVSGDPTRLRQIMLNHVSNAVKFTERGDIALAVSAGAAGEVVVSVRDTGVGLSAEQLGRLFQPFSQADASTTRQFGGTGLGLSISRHLAQLMGGHIAVESAPGQGAEFRITLPLPAASAPEAPQDLACVDLAGVRVLVAEDNLINQAVVQAVLASIGAVIDLASDGEEALSQLRANRYDIVLMDVHMPKMDGVEALRRIRAGETGWRDQPVIALTADVMAGNQQRFMALGFDGAESKPIQPATLIAAVGAVVTASAAGRPEPEWLGAKAAN